MSPISSSVSPKQTNRKRDDYNIHPQAMSEPHSQREEFGWGQGVLGVGRHSRRVDADSEARPTILGAGEEGGDSYSPTFDDAIEYENSPDSEQGGPLLTSTPLPQFSQWRCTIPHLSLSNKRAYVNLDELVVVLLRSTNAIYPHLD